MMRMASRQQVQAFGWGPKMTALRVLMAMMHLNSTVEDRGMPEEAHVEEAAQADLRPPEPAVNRPTRARKRKGRPAAPHLNHGNPIALLHESKGGNTASETRSDHNEVEVEVEIEFGATGCHTAPSSRSG